MTAAGILALLIFVACVAYNMGKAAGVEKEFKAQAAIRAATEARARE